VLLSGEPLHPREVCRLLRWAVYPCGGGSDLRPLRLIYELPSIDEPPQTRAQRRSPVLFVYCCPPPLVSPLSFYQFFLFWKFLLPPLLLLLLPLLLQLLFVLNLFLNLLW
jgi:hypothetical protein